VNKTTYILTLILQITLTFVATSLLTSCNNNNLTSIPTTQADTISTQARRFFTFTPITADQFQNAFKNNYNAPFATDIGDTLKLEKAFASIEKTYNDSEKELAGHELCKSPRCLTSFKAYYPKFDLYLFEILDYHYGKASFVYASTNEMASGHQRFRGEYGVMSKDGLWVGLERGDCDNYLQIEICKSSKNGVWSIFTFDFNSIDINEDIKNAIFWADKNKIYIATKEYDKNDKALSLYYEFKFDY
jgi:hypothetical protein